MYSKWSISFRFPSQETVCISLRPMRAKCPAHLILIQPNRIWSEVHIMKVSVLQFHTASFHLHSPLSAVQLDKV